jgi:hypothetical protein
LLYCLIFLFPQLCLFVCQVKNLLLSEYDGISGRVHTKNSGIHSWSYAHMAIIGFTQPDHIINNLLESTHDGYWDRYHFIFGKGNVNILNSIHMYKSLLLLVVLMICVNNVKICFMQDLHDCFKIYTNRINQRLMVTILKCMKF